MKRKTLTQLLLAFLCLCMMICVISCNGEKTPEPDTGSQSGEPGLPTDALTSEADTPGDESSGTPGQTTADPEQPTSEDPGQTTADPDSSEETTEEPQTQKSVETADIDNVDKGWTDGWH